MGDLKALQTLIDEPPSGDGEATVVDLPKKRRGPPKGRTKVPGSGRQRGTPNHTTVALRRRIHRRGKPVEAVCDVAAGKIEIEGLPQADAIKLLFKAVVPELRGEIISGPDDGPVTTVNILQDAQKLTDALADMPASKLDGDVLQAAQVVGFAHELARRANGAAPAQEAPQTREAPIRPCTPAAVDSAPPEPVESGDPTAPDPGHVLRFMGSDWFIRGHAPTRPNTPVYFELHAPVGGLIKRASFAICMDLLTKQLGGDLGEWRIEEPPPQISPSHPDQHAVRSWVAPTVNRRRPRTS